MECKLPEGIEVEIEVGSIAPILMGNFWMLHIDKASNIGGSRGGMILVSPNRVVAEQALCVSFKTSNNKIKYEVLLAGLRLAHKLGICHLKAFSDSQQVIGQIREKYEAKAPTLEKYL